MFHSFFVLVPAILVQLVSAKRHWTNGLRKNGWEVHIHRCQVSEHDLLWDSTWSILAAKKKHCFFLPKRCWKSVQLSIEVSDCLYWSHFVVVFFKPVFYARCLQGFLAGLLHPKCAGRPFGPSAWFFGADGDGLGEANAQRNHQDFGGVFGHQEPLKWCKGMKPWSPRCLGRWLAKLVEGPRFVEIGEASISCPHWFRNWLCSRRNDSKIRLRHLDLHGQLPELLEAMAQNREYYEPLGVTVGCIMSQLRHHCTPLVGLWSVEKPRCSASSLEILELSLANVDMTTLPVFPNLSALRMYKPEFPARGMADSIGLLKVNCRSSSRNGMQKMLFSWYLILCSIKMHTYVHHHCSSITFFCCQTWKHMYYCILYW